MIIFMHQIEEVEDIEEENIVIIYCLKKKYNSFLDKKLSTDFPTTQTKGVFMQQ